MRMMKWMFRAMVALYMSLVITSGIVDPSEVGKVLCAAFGALGIVIWWLYSVHTRTVDYG